MDIEPNVLQTGFICSDPSRMPGRSPVSCGREVDVSHIGRATKLRVRNALRLSVSFGPDAWRPPERALLNLMGEARFADPTSL
jgi:hypothetical protein